MKSLGFSDERGALSPFVVVFLPMLAGFAGLAYDGGQMFAARREATNVAAAAARAGANDIAIDSLYLDPEGLPRLAPTAASTAVTFAQTYGEVTGVQAVILGDDQVSVTVERDVEMQFLQIFGISNRTVDGSAIARVSVEGN